MQECSRNIIKLHDEIVLRLPHWLRESNTSLTGVKLSSLISANGLSALGSSKGVMRHLISETFCSTFMILRTSLQ